MAALTPTNLGGTSDARMPVDRDQDALLIVDVQNDFCPGGALAVTGGDEVVGSLNRLMGRFRWVAASQDWHPPDHGSFSESPRFEDASWPPHCVAGTPGAELHPKLALPSEAHRVRKATTRERDAYSAFDGTDLAAWLRERGVRRLFVGGLATDYCVQASVLAAREAGFETYVLKDAVRAVGDPADAWHAMAAAGAQFIDSDQIP